MVSPTLNSISLGKLLQISNELNSNLIPLPMPTGSSEETEVFDMLGRTRLIGLSGIFVGITADVKVQIEAIENLIGSEQSSSVDLVTDELGTKSVKLISISTVWDVSGVSNRCEYKIQLVEGV